MLKEFNCLKFDGDKFIESRHEVIEEVLLSIFINGKYFVTAMISPQMVKEFVIGHLFSEKVIKDIKEIESLQAEENIVKVIINNPLKVLLVKKTNRKRMRWRIFLLLHREALPRVWR